MRRRPAARGIVAVAYSIPIACTAPSSSLGRVQLLAQRLGDARAAQSGDALDLRDVGDRHDARHERHRDADRARALDEREVVGVVEEELGDDEVDAGGDLLLQVPDVERQIAAFLVAFGIAGAGRGRSGSRARG